MADDDLYWHDRGADAEPGAEEKQDTSKPTSTFVADAKLDRGSIVKMESKLRRVADFVGSQLIGVPCGAFVTVLGIVVFFENNGNIERLKRTLLGWLMPFGFKVKRFIYPTMTNRFLVGLVMSPTGKAIDRLEEVDTFVWRTRKEEEEIVDEEQLLQQREFAHKALQEYGFWELDVPQAA